MLVRDDLVTFAVLFIKLAYLFLQFYRFTAWLVAHLNDARCDGIPCSHWVFPTHVNIVMVSFDCVDVLLGLRAIIYAVIKLTFKFLDNRHDLLKDTNRAIWFLTGAQPTTLMFGVSQSSIVALTNKSILRSVQNYRWLLVLENVLDRALVLHGGDSFTFRHFNFHK